MDLAVVVTLATVHLFAGRLRFLRVVPRSRLLSAFGGVSVAYVFVHLLPEVAAGQDELRRVAGGLLAGVERHAYLLALAGLAVFHGIELHTRRSKRDGDATSRPAFLLGMSGFVVYNVVVGMLVSHRAAAETGGLAWLGLAVALHFVVNDFGLREHHREQYDDLGRWLLACAVLAGWLIARTLTVPPALLALLTSFLAGGIVLNVLKEELPRDRSSRFVPFVVGAAGYALLLMAV